MKLKRVKLSVPCENPANDPLIMARKEFSAPKYDLQVRDGFLRVRYGDEERIVPATNIEWATCEPEEADPLLVDAIMHSKKSKAKP